MKDKLTAVEWLELEYKKQGFLYDLDVEAAKQMEKEQIEKAFHDSMVDIVLGKMSSPKEYYNETYNKES
jgi:hypothetical protein